jgi:hypothetical protein
MSFSHLLRHARRSGRPSQLAEIAGGLGDLAPRIGRTLKIAAVVAGFAVIAIGTFLAVAAYQLATSSEAKLLSQAARDRARAAALDASTAARCDLLVSEARARSQPLPSCAKDRTGSSSSAGSGDVASTLLKAALD